MVYDLSENFIVSGRGGKTRLACGDSRFADDLFTFVEISLLLLDMDDDLRRAEDAIAVPIAVRWHKCGERLLYVGWEFFAAGIEKDDCHSNQELSKTAEFHRVANSKGPRSTHSTQILRSILP